MDAVLRDYRTTPIPDRDKALFAFLSKVNHASNQITPDDVQQVKAAGWTDDVLYDAVTVCALFNFYNVWIDATGVHDMPAMAYEMSGQRMAARGYSPPE